MPSPLCARSVSTDLRYPASVPTTADVLNIALFWLIWYVRVRARAAQSAQSARPGRLRAPDFERLDSQAQYESRNE